MNSVLLKRPIAQGRKSISLSNVEEASDYAWAQKLEMDMFARRFRNLFVTQVMILSHYRSCLSGQKWMYR